MFITMYCGGMPFDGNTIKESSLGGSESAAYYVALELAKEHKVTLFTNTNVESESEGIRYIPIGPMTEAMPLGESFHHYAMNTPTDVMIIQRHPMAFLYKWASKINLWWVHDLATKSMESRAMTQMYNIDSILCVSDWHKKQIQDTWNIDPKFISVLKNGVDLSLYEGATDISKFAMVGDASHKQIRLVYSSRPERGLENLVAPKGIMDKLSRSSTEYHLYVCSYNNVVPQMAGYYDWLYEQCEHLPNVTVLGHLTKQELADVQRQCDLCLYPTAFEETSCITAMECDAAGLPMLSSKAGALVETTKNTAATLLKLTNNDEDYHGSELRVASKVDIDSFVKKLNSENFKGFLKRAFPPSEQFSWMFSGNQLKDIIYGLFEGKSKMALAKHYIRNSDIYALRDLLKNHVPTKEELRLYNGIKDELKECYSFMENNGWGEHYAKYYEYEKERGVAYGPEVLDGQPRFELVSDYIAGLPDGSIVLDYGCAHGHFTINLAKRFPGVGFIGVDIAASNLVIAEKWAEDEELKNVSFAKGFVEEGVLRGPDIEHNSVDLIIAAEVLEHLESPANCIDALGKYLNEDGQFYITTPYGPWEAEGYEEHWPWRAHVHHLEREDIYDLFGMHKGINITVAPAGIGKSGLPMGSYIYRFNKPIKKSGKIDYSRKHMVQIPRELVSLCMIVKDASLDIGRCLESVEGVVDEIILGIDETTKDNTKEIIVKSKLHTPIYMFDIEPAVKTGFDAARNSTIKYASGDWILWIDTDEVLHNPQNLNRYLRRNQFKGYSIQQHHFSREPMGVMKTDLPVRLFRNNEDIKFFGVVHEHPETEINEGVGRAINVIDVEIAHYGYHDEPTRRKRFERNIGLMIRDRETYPRRKLGKFLWLRDLSQMVNWELKRNGMRVTQEMMMQAKQGMDIFNQLLTKDTIKMALDGLEFYSPLANLLGGVELKAEVEGHRIQGFFQNVVHFKKLINLIIEEKAERYVKTKYS